MTHSNTDQQQRKEAFAVYPYPCIGNFRFLDLSLHASKAHDEVIDRVREGAKFLDLGCCFGQEIRYLVPTARVLGV